MSVKKQIESTIDSLHFCAPEFQEHFYNKLRFLTKLVEMAKAYGWSGDYIEIRDFVEFCITTEGQELKDFNLEPYEVENDEHNELNKGTDIQESNPPAI